MERDTDSSTVSGSGLNRSMIGSARRTGSVPLIREDPVVQKDHSHQHLSSIPADLFISTETLIYLNISNNKFLEFPSGLGRFHVLQEIHAAFNSMTIQSIPQIYTLTSLNLSRYLFFILRHSQKNCSQSFVFFP